MRSFTGKSIDSFTNELGNRNWFQMFDHKQTTDPLISCDDTVSVKL